MELVLNEKDLSAILLRWAELNICPDAFNTVESDVRYSALQSVRLTYVEPPMAKVAE